MSLSGDMEGAENPMGPFTLRMMRPMHGTGEAHEAGWPVADQPVVHAERIGDLAAQALTAELDTWPKPGLVSHIDRGSHTDMDCGTFRRSIAALRPFFVDLAIAGSAGAGVERLRDIGCDAEAAMLDATGGVNTHRGAIFALGLLCAAAGAVQAAGHRSRPSAALLTELVRRRWGAALSSGPIPLRSHGTDVLLRFGAGGARAEAAAGFPNARCIGLTALRQGRALLYDAATARVHAFFALLAMVEDTNLLYRAGPAGLRDAQRVATRFLAAGGVAQADWKTEAVAIHLAFMQRRLSPGGSANLLAAAIFLDLFESEA